MASHRSGRRRKGNRRPTAFYPVVQRLGGIRRASRALGLDPHYILMLAYGERPLTAGVLDRLASLGQERPS